MSGDKKGWTKGESFEGVDWSKISTEPLGPIEAGIYFATTASADPQASNADKAKLVHTMMLVKKYGEADELSPPRKKQDTIPVQAATLFRVKAFADALGVGYPKSSFPDDVEAWAFDVVEAGQKGFWVLIEPEPYEDKRTKTMKMGSKVTRYLKEDECAEAAAALANAEAAPAPSPGPSNGAAVEAPKPRRTRSKEATA